MNSGLGADRAGLEELISADARALTAESEQIGRLFADVHDVHATDFRALLQILVAERAGTPLTSGELGQRLGLSGSAITYLVERMIASGHVRRDSDVADRRKVILRYSDHGRETAGAFFIPLATHTRAAMVDISDSDLVAAHSVFATLIDAMRTFKHELTASMRDQPPETGTTSSHPHTSKGGGNAGIDRLAGPPTA